MMRRPSQGLRFFMLKIPLRRFWIWSKTVPMLRLALLWFAVAVVSLFGLVPLPYMIPAADFMLFLLVPSAGIALWLITIVTAARARQLPPLNDTIAVLAMPLAAAIAFTAPLVRTGEWATLTAYVGIKKRHFTAIIDQAMAEPPTVPHFRVASENVTIYMRGAA
jgi:hypothetical protein